MPRFKVVTRDGSGRKSERTLEASSRAEALSEARRTGGTVVSVTEQGKRKASGRPWYQVDLFSGGKPRPRISVSDFAVFTRQFSTMISAGINVLECLDVLQEQADDIGFKDVLREMVDDVRSGTDLSTAMSKHQRPFTRIYVNMIRAGETAGQLDEILGRLADYTESTDKLRREIRSAMTYPVISLGMIMVIAGFLLLFIVPKFESMFQSMAEGAKLPGPTRAVLFMSRWMQTYWWAILGGSIVLYLLIRYVKKTDAGGYLWDKMMLKMPIVGPLNQKIVLSRFSRTFSTLTRSGVEILGALDIVSATSGNRVIEKAVAEARSAISGGESIAKPLQQSGVFPPMVVRMVAIGEKSGALEQLLEKIADFYDDQVTAAVDQMTSLIEPLMLGVMGLIVGGIVVAIYLPIFKMSEALSKR